MQSSHEQGTDTRKSAEGLKNAPVRTVWKSGGCITLQDGLCEKVPHSTTNEGRRNNQDLESQQ
eukprot:3265284-Prorocentrum_lima.AAC.1